MRNSNIMDDYADDYPEEPPSPLADKKTKKHTKQHYVWLVEKLLDGLREQNAFENNHPTLATSSDLSTIRKEMETALCEGMRMVHCYEQVHLLEAILEEGDSPLGSYLTDLIDTLEQEISECTFNGTLHESQTNHDAKTVQTIFPKESKLQKATARVNEQIQRTILGRKILIQSLNVGSAAFRVESSIDKMVKSYMRSGDLGLHQQKEA